MKIFLQEIIQKSFNCFWNSYKCILPELHILLIFFHKSYFLIIIHNNNSRRITITTTTFIIIILFTREKSSQLHLCARTNNQNMFKYMNNNKIQNKIPNKGNFFRFSFILSSLETCLFVCIKNKVNNNDNKIFHFIATFVWFRLILIWNLYLFLNDFQQVKEKVLSVNWDMCSVYEKYKIKQIFMFENELNIK